MDTVFPGLVALAALAVPLLYAVTALAAPRRAGLATVGGAALAGLFAIGSGWSNGASTLGVRFDGLTSVVLALVTFLGAIVVRYSHNYLAGEPERDRYFRWMLLTLGAVTTLVSSSNMMVIAVAWVATSGAVVRLLRFYSGRQAALVAAHKKFLVSRLADIALGASLWLLYANVGSFDLARIEAWVEGRNAMPVSMEVAAGLLVAAVALRGAQLPFHGWITQVMEAPTPVSALLHAGVVNMGGFVLLRLAPWISIAAPARLLLVAIGLTTAVVAALVMTTRVSVKVALAWSTCAQMGFMLLQCGLGLWALALLHLVAHSLFKAHAFLSAGRAVDDWKERAFARTQPPSPHRVGVSTIVALVVAFTGVAVVGPHIGLRWETDVASIVSTGLLGLSLVVLLGTHPVRGILGALGAAGRVMGLVGLYVGGHALAEHVFPTPDAAAVPVAWWATGAGFVALFVLKTAIQSRPAGALAKRLHPWLFAGLYLDELFTSLAFRLWPPRLRPDGEVGVESRGGVAVNSEVRA